jgi:hypothetical protein
VLGGLVLVALIAGGNPFDLIDFANLTQTISTVVDVLLAQPVALAAFLGALGVVLAGGSVLMFAVKAGIVRPAPSKYRRYACRPCSRPTRPRSSGSPTACGTCSRATCASASG